MSENTLLQRLEGLEHKFEEISTLITDPSVIADMKRYVKLNKEYRDLERIVSARKEYVRVLSTIAEAKSILETAGKSVGIDGYVFDGSLEKLLNFLNERLS